jgi:uncharacterized membrane protein
MLSFIASSPLAFGAMIVWTIAIILLSEAIIIPMIPEESAAYTRGIMAFVGLLGFFLVPWAIAKMFTSEAKSGVSSAYSGVKTVARDIRSAF